MTVDWRLRLRKVALLAGGLLLGLLLAEILLRLFAPQVFPVHPPGLYVADAEAGYLPTPGFTGRLRRAEFDTTVHIDDNGLRRTLPPPAGPGAPLRVLCLGDSMTFGLGVEDAETYPSVLQARLQAALPGRRVEALNAGVAGYGTIDALAYLRSRGAALKPDLVIYQFLPLNDFMENRMPAATRSDVRDGMLVSTVEDESALEIPLASRAKEMLKRHSHLACLLFDRAGYLLMRFGALGALEGMLGESGEDFTEEDRLRATQALVGIAETARELGAKTLFLYASGQDRVIGDQGGPLRTRAFMEESASAAGVAWVDVAGWMRQHDDRMEFYYPQDGHWTSAGTRAVAELLAERVTTLDLLPAGDGIDDEGKR